MLLEKVCKNCKSITDMFDKACDKTPVSHVVNRTKIMLITQQQVLGKTNNKGKILNKVLWKKSQLT